MINDYLNYVGILGFTILCVLQVKLWCLMFHTCGVIWKDLKSWTKKGR